MTFPEKLFSLRKANKMSQEDLADILDVSRQAVQKWEAGASSPDMRNLLAISKHFEISLDVLLKDEYGLQDEPAVVNSLHSNPYYCVHSHHYEYRSKWTLWGLPLLHVKLGHRSCIAKGIIAVGNVALGLVTLGGVSVGLLALGGIGLGLLSLAGLSLGGITLGGISMGLLSFGGVAIGYFSLGGLALGHYAAGGVAIATKIAVGDVAHAHLAIGNKIKGSIIITPLQHAINNPELVEQLILQEWPRISKTMLWIFRQLLFVV